MEFICFTSAPRIKKWMITLPIQLSLVSWHPQWSITLPKPWWCWVRLLAGRCGDGSSGISLTPNSPSDKLCERGHGFSIGGAYAGSTSPPILDGASKCQEDVSMFSVWSLSITKFQSLRVYRRLKNRCVQDSFSLLQRGERQQFGHPRLANLSAVQILCYRGNQAKNLTFDGAQTSYTICSTGERIVPYKRRPPSSAH